MSCGGVKSQWKSLSYKGSCLYLMK